MKPSTLDEHVRDHFESASPSPQLLDRLVVATREADVEDGHASHSYTVPRPSSPTERSTLKPLLWAAILLITVGTGWFVQSRLATAETARRVADEIALNHVKDLGVDVRAATWSELRDGLDKLDFVLAASSRLDARGLRLEGGRYCSIQGGLAAQIQMFGPDGERLTLYQTSTTEALASLDQTLAASGVEVEMWNEQGLFFGLATSPSD